MNINEPASDVENLDLNAGLSCDVSVSLVLLKGTFFFQVARLGVRLWVSAKS